jgi:excisionase family DNA binding protein
MVLMSEHEEELVSEGLADLPEVCRFLRLGRTKVYSLVTTGELPVVRLGRALRIPRRALLQYAARLLEQQRQG